MQAVLRDFAAKDATGLFGAVKADESASRTEDLGEAVGRREDFGEVISRGDDETKARDAKTGLKKKDVPESGVDVVVRKKKKKEKRTAEPEPEPEPEPPKKKKKTKKGKGSAIDDLFAGL